MLTLDQNDRNNFLYKGKSVARLSTIGDRTVVEIKLSYEASAEDWIVPLSYLAKGSQSWSHDRRPWLNSNSARTASDRLGLSR